MVPFPGVVHIVGPYFQVSETKERLRLMISNSILIIFYKNTKNCDWLRRYSDFKLTEPVSKRFKAN